MDVVLSNRLKKRSNNQLFKGNYTPWISYGFFSLQNSSKRVHLTFILRRFRTGMVWFYTSTSNKRASRPKLCTKSLTRDLKLMY